MRNRPSALEPAKRLCWPYCVGGMSSQAKSVRRDVGDLHGVVSRTRAPALLLISIDCRSCPTKPELNSLPTGVLRAGINLSNFLLVTGPQRRMPNRWASRPTWRAEIAASLGVPITYVTFKSPGELGDQAGKNVWDIGLIGAEPQRAR